MNRTMNLMLTLAMDVGIAAAADSKAPAKPAVETAKPAATETTKPVVKKKHHKAKKTTAVAPAAAVKPVTK